jgi:phosphate starvation-inducible PhoH-like protein
MTFDDNDRLRELAGELGAHLRQVETALGVRVDQRGQELRIHGAADAVRAAERVLGGLYDVLGGGRGLSAADVRHAVRAVAVDASAPFPEWFRASVGTTVDGRPIVPRTEGQRRWLDALASHDLAIAVGPAGSGKTWLGVASALASLRRGDVKRLVLTRPAVEAGEKLGFLPGDLAEKVDPYLRPLYDAIFDMVPADRFARMVEKRQIEVAPLAFMRGRTLSHAAVLLDEAQNTTREQMKMFLTRLGEGSRLIVTGDITQIDLPPRIPSGLVDALDVLRDVPGVGVVQLDFADVVRHPLVAAIAAAYARHEGR